MHSLRECTPIGDYFYKKPSTSTCQVISDQQSIRLEHRRFQFNPIGGSRGAPGTRAPPGSKFFHFHAVFGKNYVHNMKPKYANNAYFHSKLSCKFIPKHGPRIQLHSRFSLTVAHGFWKTRMYFEVLNYRCNWSDALDLKLNHFNSQSYFSFTLKLVWTNFYNSSL